MKYFVYFSLTGNGDFLAEELSKKGYQIVKVEMIKEVKKVGFFTILKYGGRAMANKKEKIKTIELSIDKDDEAIIGSPVWADHLSTPITTVLSMFDFNKENTGFILYPAGEGTKKSFKQIKKLGFNKEPIIISYPLKKKEAALEILAKIS